MGKNFSLSLETVVANPPGHGYCMKESHCWVGWHIQQEGPLDFPPFRVPIMALGLVRRCITKDTEKHLLKERVFKRGWCSN